MRTRGKVAVTIAAELLEEIERIRKRSGESRSAVFERALQAYVATLDRAAEARAYIAAYRRMPESAAEQRVMAAMSLEALAAEPWDEEG